MSSANRGECVTTGGLYRTTRLCVAHFELHKNVEVRWGGGGCWDGPCFRSMGFVWGFREWRCELSSGLSQPGRKICWAVWSRVWCSGTVFLMVGAGRDCEMDGWCPSRYYWLYWSIVQGKNIQDGGERGTDDFCSCVHCPLEGLAVCCTTVPVPDSDAAGQHALNGSPVEGGEDG